MSEELTREQERQLADLVVGVPLADALAERMAAAGHQLYLVGGSVRDALLGRGQHDLDFATSAHPADTKRALAGWADDLWDTGARFGTISARKDGWQLELTTFRVREAYTKGSRHPDVEYGTTIEGDLARRDFTVNAMAVGLPQRRFVDPFGGLADLRAGVLRTPIDPERSFADDPLRMVRLARFAAQLQARADEATVQAAGAMASELATISAERIREELSRLLMSPGQALGLDLLCETGLADQILPELPALRMERDPLHHHKDVYAHTIAVIDRAEPPSDLTLRLAALLHDIGKPATRRFEGGGKVTFHHHEVVGARMAKARLQALRYPKGVIEDVTDLVRLHLRFHGYSDGEWTDSAVRRYVHDAGAPEQLRRLNTLTRADVTTRNRSKARRLQRAMDDFEERIARIEREEELAAMRPALDGHQIMSFLGLPPGRQVGEARTMLLDARIHDGPMTEQEAYDRLAVWAKEQGLEPADGAPG